MNNNELLKKYAGISTRIRRTFAYHYDQIQREVQTEISTLDPKLQAQFMDLIIEYMEETMNWPEPDNQETFEKQITRIMPSRDGNPITRKQKSFINLRYQTYSNN